MARISRRYPTVAELLKDATVLSSAIAEEEADLPNLQQPRERLDEKLNRLRELLVQVNALQAQKQGLVQEMHTLQEDAAKLVSFLELGVKQRYGNRSEALLKFRVKPFRRQKISRRPPEAPGGVPEVSDAGQE
jgi:ABC-type transporter Mla subunit MlaD